MDRFRIGIIGADSPQGQQLMKLLLAHPIAELVAVSTTAGTASLTGSPVGSCCPSLLDRCTLSFVSDLQVMTDADVVFNADLAADSQELAAGCIKNKCVFIDLGHSFRIADEETYQQWYGTGFSYPGLNDAAVYGLPELMREHMSGKVLVGVSGAVATGALLALVPLLNEQLIEPEGITITALLPAAGNGSGLSACTDSFAETAEIEQLLSQSAGRVIRTAVTPCFTQEHRGMLVVCTARTTLSASTRTIRTALNNYYTGEQFVRILPPGGRGASSAAVEGSNLCEISCRFDERTGTITVSAALDSLMKGSAGQAVQCMNRLLSMPEEIGVDALPIN